MKIHYDPFQNPNDDDSCSDYSYCGVYISDGNSSGDKDNVTCKKCQKKFKQADQELLHHIDEQAKYWDGFVDFMMDKQTLKTESND